jgi:hypothetical protein
MIQEAILKAVTHTTLILFMGLVALLPLHLILKMQLNQFPVGEQEQLQASLQVQRNKSIAPHL